MVIALASVFSAASAQDKSDSSDKALSAQYKHDIDVLNSEIKTAKLKLKADQKNPDLRSDLKIKQEQLKNVKSKKKIIDDAIKSKAAAEKAAKKAEKAEKKAQKSANDAQRLR